MSYIKCKSFLTGKDVQYGLIDVKLKHKVLNANFGAQITSSTTYWNTSPEWATSIKYIRSGETATGWSNSGSSLISTITGRGKQSWSASGILSSEYLYVNKNMHPVIAQSAYDINDMEIGTNTFDLFETDTVKVVLECEKQKASVMATDYSSYSFCDIDGKITEDEYVLINCIIKQVLKSNNKVIGEYSISRNIYNSVFPVRFAISTEIFRVIDFDARYYTGFSYSSRYSLYLDAASVTGNKLYSNGNLVDSGDFVGLTFSILMSEYWYTSRNNDDFKKYRIVTDENILISNNELKSFNTDAQIKYFHNKIETNPNEFIIMVGSSTGGGKFLTTDEQCNFANSEINKGNKYFKSAYEVTKDNNIFTPSNFIQTPILVPLVDSDYNNVNLNSKPGIFIPLTSTVFEGDPEPPEPVPPEPEPETIEPADDPETVYTPELPSDMESGYEEYPYEGKDVITGRPFGYETYGPSYTNYIFKAFYKSTTDFVQDAAYELIYDCTNACASDVFQTAWKLVTGTPKLTDLISRVYELPFEYDEIFKDDVLPEVTMVYGWIKNVCTDFSNQGEPTGTTHYYKRYTQRFKYISLGSATIKRVFKNYLDFTDTTYTLNLPYGAPSVELDPNFLFLNNAESAEIELDGYIDFDTGYLVIKVLINGQLYYETSVNIAIDRIATMADATAVSGAIGKMGISVGTSIATSFVSSVTSDIGRTRRKEKESGIEKYIELENLKQEHWKERQVIKERAKKKGDD